jgi:hypothetical protein
MNSELITGDKSAADIELSPTQNRNILNIKQLQNHPIDNIHYRALFIVLMKGDL